MVRFSNNFPIAIITEGSLRGGGVSRKYDLLTR